MESKKRHLTGNAFRVSIHAWWLSQDNCIFSCSICQRLRKVYNKTFLVCKERDIGRVPIKLMLVKLPDELQMRLAQSKKEALDEVNPN